VRSPNSVNISETTAKLLHVDLLGALDANHVTFRFPLGHFLEVINCNRVSVSDAYPDTFWGDLDL